MNTRSFVRRRQGSHKNIFQKGVAVIEMALTLPLLLLVVFGIIEYGFALYNKAVITNISREAVRDAILFRVTPKTSAQVKSFAETRCANRVVSFKPASCTATVTYPGSVVSGATAAVQMSYNYSGFLTYKSANPIVATTQMNFE